MAATRAAKLQIEKFDDAFIWTQPLQLKRGSTKLLEQLAAEAGWGKIRVNHSIVTPEVFRVDVLGKVELFFDAAGPSIGHPGSEHAL